MTEQYEKIKITESQLVEMMCDVSREGRTIDAGAIQLFYLDYDSPGKWAVHDQDGDTYITVVNPQAFKDTAELRNYLAEIASEPLTDGEQSCSQFDRTDIPMTNP